MSDLRKKLIRLAHQKPHLRRDLLPLIQKQASSVSIGWTSVRYNGKIYREEVREEPLKRGANPRNSNPSFRFEAFGRGFRIEWTYLGKTFVEMADDPHNRTKSGWRIVVDGDLVGSVTLYHANKQWFAIAEVGTEKFDMGWHIGLGNVIGSAALGAYIKVYGTK